MGTPAAHEGPLGTGMTTLTLSPAQAKELTIAVTSTDILSGATAIYGVVELPLDVPECRADNNTATELSRSCLI